MARRSRDEGLATRTARLKLAPRGEPYWRTIQEGRAVGYRRLKGSRSGSWIARYYTPHEGRQIYALASADDFMDADGVGTLSFAQAQDAARAWFAELDRSGGKVIAPITVREAMVTYMAAYAARGGKAARDTQRVIDAHILPSLGDKKVGELTARAIKAWLTGIAAAPARLRSAANAIKQRARVVASGDAEGLRARRATANRILTVLKAALNQAFRDEQVASDDAWRRVKPFANVDAAKVRYLKDNEIGPLLGACGREIRPLVTAALLTGCRYQELTTLRPVDVDLAAGVVNIRASKAGGSRSVVITDEGRRFFENAMAGKTPRAILFARESEEMWRKSQQFRPLRLACAAAGITPAISFHVLRHTHASRLAMQGVPMAVIAAQLGHSDVKITAKHYAHLSPGYVADTIRAAFRPLGI